MIAGVINHGTVMIRIVDGKIKKISITVPGFDEDDRSVSILEGDIVVTSGFTCGVPGIVNITIDNPIPKECR